MRFNSLNPVIKVVAMSQKRFLCLCVFGFVLGLLQAQDKVRVLDGKNDTPLVGVNVIAVKSTVTDEEGFFHLENIGVLSDSDTITLSHIGYETKKMVGYEMKRERVIYLIPRSYLIEEISVSKEKFKYESVVYEALTPLKYGVYSFGATLVGDSIFVIGGDATIKDESYSHYIYKHNSGKLQIYDIKNDCWSVSKTKFSNRANHNIHYAKGKIYVLGGKRLSPNPEKEYLNDLVEVYDIQQELLLSSNSNPHQAVDFASGLYEDAIIVMNGSIRKHKDKKIYTHKVHLFDLNTGYWYEMDTVPCAYEATAIAVDSVLYQVGRVKNQAMGFINSYHFLSGIYRTEAILPFLLERPALAYNEEKRTLYIYERSMLLAYDLETKEICRYRIDLDLMYSQMVCKGNYLYIIGGKVLDEDSEFKKIMGEEFEFPGEVISVPSSSLFRVDVNTLASTKFNKVPDRSL